MDKKIAGTVINTTTAIITNRISKNSPKINRLVPKKLMRDKNIVGATSNQLQKPSIRQQEITFEIEKT